VLDLIRTCRTLFGRTETTEEDRIRVQSLRTAGSVEMQAAAANSGDFVAQLDAEITLSYSTSADDRRAFELVNKTNQFNLNGRRLTEADWKAHFRKPGAFLMTVSYTDRFGPLGKIAALLGHGSETGVNIDAWVLSCRAFSRQVEHHALRSIFERTNVPQVTLAYARTERNEPVRTFLSQVSGGAPDEGEQTLLAEDFGRHCPRLHGRVVETSHE
jgi:FkbH-like protein